MQMEEKTLSSELRFDGRILHVFEDDILYVKGGLPFKFMKSVSAEEMATVKTWVEGILSKLK